MGTSLDVYELNHESARDIELIIKYKVTGIPSVLSLYFRSWNLRRR